MPTQSQPESTLQNPKEVAGRAAAQLVETGMTVGLGTGSTVFFTLVALAERMAAQGLELRGIPTSVDTENKAREMGIPLVALNEVDHIDLTIDGADESDRNFRLTKGGGGALLREKVV
ncbi:MAG: ribose 5-phosphate isomerase A, partial [Planctomycetota bacterium]|nr:ribose 5-phosphate isomerase A [Planctomycetota bacterium]